MVDGRSVAASFAGTITFTAYLPAPSSRSSGVLPIYMYSFHTFAAAQSNGLAYTLAPNGTDETHSTSWSAVGIGIISPALPRRTTPL